MKLLSFYPALVGAVAAAALLAASDPCRAIDRAAPPAAQKKQLAAQKKLVVAPKKVAVSEMPTVVKAAGTVRDVAPHVAAVEQPPSAAAAPAGAPPPSEIQRQFCLNNAASANDARIAWEGAKLAELDAKIKQRISELEAKRLDYVEWMKKRDESMKKASEDVVAIYAHMRPEAAASQLAAMNDSMAAALLAKLSPRNASAILNEMEPGRAARLTNAMVGPPPTPDNRKKS